jgi:hypothetical protein
MLIYPGSDSVALRGDLLIRAELRTDMTPVPVTIELTMRQSREVAAAIVQGKTIRVQADHLIEFTLVKVWEGESTARVQGDRPDVQVRAIGLLSTCAAIAQPSGHAVIREGATLGEIYRACGAKTRIESDFPVAVFSCFTGMEPSYQVAKSLMDEGGGLVYSKGRVAFKRLTDLKRAEAKFSLPGASVQRVGSEFIEKSAVPFAVSTDASGAIVSGRAGTGRAFVYRPRADQRIVNNMGTVLIQRGRSDGPLVLGNNAGDRIDVNGTPMVAITVAHIFEPNGQQYSRYWLGEVVS